MRWLRLLIAIMSARYRSKLTLSGESVLSFRVWLTDVDASVMNHATMMTVMETGRIDFMVRSGFFKEARKNGWYFPSKSISVQFLRPLKLFQKATLVTRVSYADEQYIYTEQKIVRNNKDIALCIAKSTVKKGRNTIPISEIAEMLQLGSLPTSGKKVIEALENGDRLMYDHLCDQ